MKKSILTLAMAAVVFASCTKTNDVTPASATEGNLAVNSKKDGKDDAAKKGGTDDNLPKHSGTDDGVKTGTDDNQIKHSGTDEKNISVPAKVTAAFSQKFPGATVREWKHNKGLYKAHFANKGVAWEASFSADGTLVKSQRAS